MELDDLLYSHNVRYRKPPRETRALETLCPAAREKIEERSSLECAVKTAADTPFKRDVTVRKVLIEHVQSEADSLSPARKAK